jgi:hypothetical protein
MMQALARYFQDTDLYIAPRTFDLVSAPAPTDNEGADWGEYPCVITAYDVLTSTMPGRQDRQSASLANVCSTEAQSAPCSRLRAFWRAPGGEVAHGVPDD